jgi:transcriptional regulator with XRE-family HTH domain
MTGQERFGPNLGRIREQRGISLEQLADRTNVDADLWAALERNDFSRWPSGIFARAFIREYARAIGIDAESTVDEFCRHFPQGDRRRGEIIRAEAELLGVRSEWHDDLAPPDRDRRRSAREAATHPEVVVRHAFLARRARMVAAGLDMAMVSAGGALVARAMGAPPLPLIAGVALAYHASSLIFFGGTAGSALVTAWLRHSTKAEGRRTPGFAFLRLRRNLRAARS